MPSFETYLSDFIGARGLNNDSELARHLGVSPQYVWKMRHEGRATDDFCLEIARVLKVEPGLVLVARDALKETGPVGDAYRRILERVAGASLLFVMAFLYVHHNVEFCEILLSFQALASLKDYRKYLILFAFQVLTGAFAAIFPVKRPIQA